VPHATLAKTAGDHPKGAKLPVVICKVAEGGIVLPDTLDGKHEIEAENGLIDLRAGVFVYISETDKGYEIVNAGEC
jgi:hypothetical protein